MREATTGDGATAGATSDAADASAASGTEPTVRVADLRYTYPGADAATLHGLTFDVAPGEVFGFLGPSGAGKSTTQRVLIGLLDGYEGTARAFGREVADWDRDYYRRIGVAGESPTLYAKLTARENLALFAGLYGGATRDPDALLERVGLADAADRRVSAFSKGMRVRLNVVRALLHDPDLLFLDEPTAGLDPSNGRVIRELIRERRDAGTAVFLTTHDMTVADDLCDRVAFVVDGRLPTIDAPAALKRRHGTPTVVVEFRRADGSTGEATFDLADLGSTPAFADLLSRVEVERLHSGEATLEDVFVAVTGRELV